MPNLIVSLLRGNLRYGSITPYPASEVSLDHRRS
jgi:hypothetical protein